MSGFNFRLQKVLDLRARAEEAAQLRLAGTKREVLFEGQRLNSLQEACESTQAQAKVEAGALPDVGLLLNNHLHLASLEAKVRDQQERLEQVQQQEDAQRVELLERSQDRQVMDKLKARQLDQYRTNQQRLESRVLDETGTLAHLQRKKDA